MSKPVVVILREEITEFAKTHNLTPEKIQDWPVELLFCNSVDHLVKILDQRPALIMAALDYVSKLGTLTEFVTMLESYFSFTKLDPVPAIGIGFCQYTTQSEINEMKKSSVKALIPKITDFGREEYRLAFDNFVAKGDYWPTHLIKKLGKTQGSSTIRGMKLSGRQLQIYHLITKRGLTNRQIGSILKISESCVKLHVTKILKKLSVRSRTQLVFTKLEY